MLFALTKEQRDIVRAARKFAQGEFPDRALEFDREETFDFDLWKRACELGFVGVFIDQAYGGAGMRNRPGHCLLLVRLRTPAPVRLRRSEATHITTDTFRRSDYLHRHNGTRCRLRCDGRYYGCH